MSNPIFDDSHLAELGREYELFVGAYYETILHCVVVYQGKILDKRDGGIDLIAISRDATYLIQCKNFLPSKLIHENVVNQLSGASKVFCSKFPSARNVVPVLVCTCPLDADAAFSAKINSITVNRLDYRKKTVDDRLVLYGDDFSTEGYSPISEGLNMLPDYETRLKALIVSVQGTKSPVAESNTEKSNQNQHKTEQAPEKVNQIPPATNRPPEPVSSGAVFRDEESASSTAAHRDNSRYSEKTSLFSKFLNLIHKLTYGFVYFQLCSIVLSGRGHVFSHMACWLLVFAIPSYFALKPFLLPRVKTVLKWLWCVVAVIIVLIFSLPSIIPDDVSTYKSNHSPSTPLPTATVKPTAKPTATPKATATPRPTATPKPTVRVTPVPLPSNGKYYCSDFRYTLSYPREKSVKVITPDDGYYCCLVFVDADKPSRKRFQIFVYPDSDVTVDVPTDDRLLLYIAYGTEWYGNTNYFGANTIWSTSDDVFDFKTYSYELTLKEVVGGTWETEDVSASEVPFLN